ncbi:hypothetical protein WA026_001695 [Henosepilachna vigintioctopunctata]|uniref:Carboxylesterase type B domain-containing protein n=1 Tax=Henosepilachna vigintioctopunctata TaxID=420089 RepID=A0AAW1UKE7_9CUCU
MRIPMKSFTECFLGTSKLFSIVVMIWSFISFALLGFCHCGQTPNPLVSTPLGKYEGSLLTSTLGKTIYAFRGIRYAEPPVNELRFKPPVPVKKHEGVYNAKEDAPVCPQLTNDPVSEDCLFLNVYSNKLPDKKENPKKPVIIHIHAGGFYGVTGRSNWAGPQYFMNQDIVLITFNYRLGALGFLSTGDKEAPGNNGLRDQVEVMKWVKANIEAFGGDPNSVTIFGYSAGGMSVSMHLVSPMSKGLFHKGIIGSSSTLGQFPLGRNQLDLAKRTAKILGCPDDTSVNIIKCLRGKSAVELGNSLSKMFEFGTYEPVLLWKPVIEEDFGQERFLTDHPIKLIMEGKFQKLPIMSGITAEEFGYKSIDMLRNPEMLQQLDEQWEKLAPIVFLYERNTEWSKAISKGLRSFYFGDKKIDNSTQLQLSNLYNEAQSGFAVNRGVKLLSEKNSAAVYYYRFSYKGKYSHYYLPDSNRTLTYGAVHHDDLIYMFFISTLFPKFEKSDPEFRIVQKLTTMWSNFARTGKPIPETCGRLDYAEWEPYNRKTQKYLDIGERLKAAEALYEDRIIWQIVIYTLFGICHCAHTPNPLVSSPLGKYQGGFLTYTLGKTIYAFRGIRYAEAPVNELRFKPPVPVKKHDGVYNAQDDAPVCPQVANDPISEDCLFLNVYSNELPEEKNNPKKPVIIYIHSGGFYVTAGRSNWNGPQYFMDQDVVLVTFNYRVEALGFLSTGDEEAPGNNGLRDQVEAMKWVKQNIEAFGGDPNSVTIFGCSSGAISVSLHLVSPMSKGLFHKAILGSLSILGQFSLGRNQLDLAKRTAKILKCPHDTSANIIK